jgi:SAM-dependent methyltransferase
MTVKNAVLSGLGRVGLLRPSYRVYERGRSWWSRGTDVEADGPPLPPAWLRMRVAGTADAEWFLGSGRVAMETIEESLEAAGTSLAEVGDVLDFGCGCGRVIRWLKDVPGSLRGSDFDGRAVAWCRENLRFAEFGTNGLEPPLGLDDESLDFVYAFSVLTHLSVSVQHAWMDEFRRMLRPGGILVLSTHGDAYLPRLTESEQREFRAGEVVVRFEEVAGTNLCTAFHPRTVVEESLADGFEVIRFTPAGARGSPPQDLVVLRKPPG